MKFAIREAVDVYFKAKSTFKLGARTIRAGEPVLIFDTIKVGTMTVAAEISYVTGGRGNARLLSYEGDKSLTFSFDDALLSAEGLAILSGAELIPARNKHLPGAPAEAEPVRAHKTESYSVTTGNRIDKDTNNVYPDDAALGATGDRSPMGGFLNVWLTEKPYVGQNASIYVMLLDQAGEMSGSPLEINLKNEGKVFTMTSLRDALTAAGVTDGGTFKGVTIQTVANPTQTELNAVNDELNKYSYLAKFSRAEANKFIAFDKAGAPMSKTDFPDPQNLNQQGVFDDMVGYYVDPDSAKMYWTTAWGAVADIDTNYVRTIGAAPAVPGTGPDAFQAVTGSPAGGWSLEAGMYGHLVAPSGGVGEPKAFKEGANIVYKVNVPSILYQDIVLLDYYVTHRHDAVQISILPDKFGSYFYIEGSTLFRRASDGKDLAAEFVIPKFKVSTALTLTLQSTGDPSVFSFSGDAYPDFSKFNLMRKVLADIQILGADDNYDGASGDTVQADPTSYRRYQYNENTEGAYLWKDPSLEPHSNIDYSDTGDYVPTHGGAATLTPGLGLIDTAPSDGAQGGVAGPTGYAKPMYINVNMPDPTPAPAQPQAVPFNGFDEEDI